MKVINYVMTHKKYDIPELPGYIPLQVGASTSDEIFYPDHDNTGVNISIKNNTYSELTGIYWVWKNSLADIIAISHYRRYFFDPYLMNFSQLSINRMANEIQNGTDIVLPIYRKLSVSNIDFYSKYHQENDIYVLRQVILNLYPDYLESFDEVFESRKLSCFNMLITSKLKFDQYCNWLFEILFECERRLDISERNTYQSRVFGFMSERLLNVWVKKNRLKVKYYPVLNIEQNIQFKKRLRLIVKYISQS